MHTFILGLILLAVTLPFTIVIETLLDKGNEARENSDGNSRL